MVAELHLHPGIHGPLVLSFEVAADVLLYAYWDQETEDDIICSFECVKSRICVFALLTLYLDPTFDRLRPLMVC